LFDFFSAFFVFVLHAQNSENVYFFLRNKWVENQNDPKQMPLKDKPRQLRQWKKHSLVDSSSSDDDDDDDASSGNEEVILFLIHFGTGM
jgi:hypothetical protein